MNPEHQQLIDRYYDGLTEAREVEELNTILQNDVAAARAFVQTGRMEALIERHYATLEAEEDFEAELAASPVSRRRHRYAARKIQPAWRRWRGPAGSILLHAAVILLLVKFLVFRAPESAPPVQVELRDDKPLMLDDLEEKLEAVDYLAADRIHPPPASRTFDLVQPPPVADVTPSPAEPPVLVQLQPVPTHRTAFYYRNGDRRGRLADRFAGRWAAASEKAIVRSMNWLADRQLKHGALPGRQKAMTALGLLTWLGHGETTDSPDYGEAVEAAMKFMLGSAQDGYWGDAARRGRGGADKSVYEHAIATYAMAEAYAMTRIPELRPVLERAVDHIIAGQQDGGGWDYGYNPREDVRTDMSVSGWHIQALAAAQQAGIQHPDMIAAMRKAANYCIRMQHPQTGEFSYSREGAGQYSDAMTGVAVYSLHLLERGQSRAAVRGAEALAGLQPDWQAAGGGGLYAWYYITHARFAADAGWRDWHDGMAPLLIEHQQRDGSWSHPAASPGFEEGPVYSTTLAALTLSVYYRQAQLRELALLDYQPRAVHYASVLDELPLLFR